jgi:LPXTG-motif cell wall-anchored protein
MKRNLLALSLGILLFFTGSLAASSQDEPKPKKDTVNMDTYAKPETYYEIEDEKASASGKSSTTTIIIIVAAVIVVAGVGFFLLKKKK